MTWDNGVVVSGRWLGLAVLTGGCVTLSPVAEQVSVYHQPFKASAPARVPAPCRLVAATPMAAMTELEMEGQTQPYRRQREKAAAAGANALLVRTRLKYSRRDFECPGASPITDCPGSSGAWFDVVLESYACPSAALEELAAREPREPETSERASEDEP